MTRNPSIPVLGLDHAQYADARLCALLSTTELGALVRLIQFSWYWEPPCTLPSAPAALAEIAGLAEGEWAKIEDRLLVALGSESINLRDGTPGISLTFARSVYDRQAHRLEQLRSAGKASARARAGPPPPGTMSIRSTHVEHMFNTCSNRRSDDASGVSSRARGREALERSKSAMNQERSSAHHPATSNQTPDPLDRSAIAGAIYDGLEAAAEAKVRQWRADQARQLLERACASWAAKGMLKDPNGRDRLRWQDDAIRIASVPHITPAAMEIAINRCNLRACDADGTPINNALGYVIRALGAFRGGRPLEPYLTDQPIVDRWAQLERRLFDASKALAAAEGASRRIDDARKRLSPQSTNNAGNVAGA